MGAFLNRFWRRRAEREPTWQPTGESLGQQRRFTRWQAARTYLNWTGPWFKAYHYRRAGLPPAGPVQPLRSPESDGTGPPHGVALLYDERIGPINFRHLFTLLRVRVLALGYRVAHADQHPCPHGLHPADIIEKYVLHPLPTPSGPEAASGAGCCNQRFGQVTVDLLRRDRQPVMIRLRATPLPDAIFTKAPSFDELLARVLGGDA